MVRNNQFYLVQVKSFNIYNAYSFYLKKKYNPKP